MAAFRTHMTVGLIVGYIASAWVVMTQWIVTPFTPFGLFLAVCIGSLLPDIDSDHSKPFSIIFGCLSMIGGSVVFFYFLQHHIISWMYWIAIPPLTALIIRYGLGKLFQKYTVHRGIFHSIPALGIATLATPLVLASFRLASQDVIAISLGVGLGFLSHLILDELYSTIDFEGHRIKPKKSLGTALAFTGPSKKVTLAAYLLLAALIVYNRWLLLDIFGR
ncbi:hypothetical protein CSA56_09750 [candidate division KSB3 bacterium]|uniref:Metal-dependent hydrolase n=1 Tax=candidate division KSB3 bacterium TaxID=2044937 RepID=A0A2G6KDN7_9BACT|nr:MAG: hypothetical protein CSA56_09750 [candidate division KSB3 bacterium]